MIDETGAMTEFDLAKNTYVKRFHYEGKTYDETEFRRLMGFGDEGSLIGVHVVVAEKVK